MFNTYIFPILILILSILVPYILSKPRLIFLETSWVVRGKKVYVSRDYSKKPTTDSVGNDEREIHNYYGVTLQNKHSLGRAEAKISSTTIEIWNSDGSFSTGKYDGRYWNYRSSGSLPLFSGGHPQTIGTNESKQKQTIGDGGELFLVIAYDLDGESGFYRFTMDSDTSNQTAIYKERFSDTMPHYARIRVHADKGTITSYFFIDPKETTDSLKVRSIKKSSISFQIGD